jgi:hypothetical protein
MRNALLLLLAFGAGVGCGTNEAAKPTACAQLYEMLDRLESCATLPGPLAKEGIALKRKAIDTLIAGAKKQGEHEGLCRNEAWVLRKVYARTAPDCLK